jgi:hypothetical protein
VGASSDASTTGEELQQELQRRREVLEDSDLEASSQGAPDFQPETFALPEDAPKTVEGFEKKINELKTQRSKLSLASPQRGRLTNEITKLEGEKKRITLQKTVGAAAAADLEARKRATEKESAATKALRMGTQEVEKPEDPDSSWTKSQLE